MTDRGDPLAGDLDPGPAHSLQDESHVFRPMYRDRATTSRYDSHPREEATRC